MRKTPGDYVAIAIAPALIVVLVGSLVLFLSELLYRGDHGGRLRWTLCWFTLATVGVTRIALEVGSSRGFLHGFALAGVTCLALVRYVDPPFAGIALLAVAWFCVDRLVRDCTLIDDDEDATGEGLLDRAGLGDRTQTSESPRVAGRLLFLQHVNRASREPPAVAPTSMDEASGKPAPPPGLWVVWFSLAALPLFGVGHALVPVTDAPRRETALTCLWFYLLSAFGLLLATSFLGLRRYLRQRRIQMPTAMALTWMTRGIVTAVGVLLTAMLLPRPDASFSLPTLVERMGSPAERDPDPNRIRGTATAVLPGTNGIPRPDPGVGLETNRASGPGTGDARTGTPPQGPQGRESGSSRPPARPSSADQPDARAPQAPIPATEWGSMLKRLVHGVFALVVLLILIRHRAWLWNHLQELWLELFSRSKPARTDVDPAKEAPGLRSVRPFSNFRNPFLHPGRDKQSPAELVAYTFDALEAWAADNGFPRRTDETPLEFGGRLSEVIPDVATPTGELMRAYSRMAYAGQPPDDQSLFVARQVWAYITSREGAVR